MEPTEGKRKRGRQRKNQSIVAKSKNPDCEPATKGYVKCLFRHFHEHETHDHAISDFSITAPIGALAVVGLIVSAILWCVSLDESIPVSYQTMFAAIFWMCGILFSGFILGGKTKTSNKRPERYPEIFKKYQPPECTYESEKECE